MASNESNWLKRIWEQNRGGSSESSVFNNNTQTTQVVDVSGNNIEFGVATGCIAVTPHNTNLLPHIGWFEVRGNAGNVAFVDEDGNPSLVLAFDQKELSKFRVKQILATGTTATDIYLYY